MIFSTFSACSADNLFNLWIRRGRRVPPCRRVMVSAVAAV
jgi:hypothetical protein